MDSAPRIPEDPPDFDAVHRVKDCFEECALHPLKGIGCPRRPPRPGEGPNDSSTFTCWGTNRPDGRQVVYVRRTVYGNEED